MSVELTQTQGEVVRKIVEWYKQPHQQEFYFAGYAGVGKTTVSNYAIEEIKAKYGIKNVASALYRQSRGGDAQQGRGECADHP